MILFIYGEDSFRSRQKLSEYQERFLKKYGPQSDLAIFDAEENKNINLQEIISARGLFSSVRLAIVKNFIAISNSEEQNKAVFFLKAKKDILADKESVMVFWEKEPPQKDSLLFKFLQKYSKAQEFKKLQGALLSKWVAERLEEINPEVKISINAREKLTAYKSSNSQAINTELEKLVNFKEKGEITENDIDYLVAEKISSAIFETIEAASSGNKKRALLLFHNHLKNKEDPFYILSMYVYQFRNLLKVGEFYWQGIFDRFVIAKKTGLHPFVVQKTLPQLKNFTFPKLKNIYQKLQNIDFEVKSGRADIKLSLDKFIVEL